ncbi:T9SS type A sorting domain-containing protein [Flavobacterium sp. 102]|uniref:T9SS type A sorting domain-containing protein n=1 Tax=Flavobacterium sp. 102 TaxID=2135623 RepID=UPI000EB295A1|nr:T9SS type A sorting domain-containing protein [Flavobacterium sp. 102]RKS01308.1 putative secreted protein (Por secretion system target) [Flavobacterium sp. 102]
MSNRINIFPVVLTTNGSLPGRQASDAKKWSSVAYGNDKFVAVCTNSTMNKAMYSGGLLAQSDFNKEKILIYPNPASDRLFIKLPGVASTENATAKMYDFRGRLVREFSINNEDFSIVLSGRGAIHS